MKSLQNKNKSEAVLFILNASNKRRSMAMSTARKVQRELGIMPTLVAVK